MNLFLKSCSYNPDITIMFFTDLAPPKSAPINVRFNYCTLDEIKLSLDRTLSIDTALTTAYKLCDIRPAYALVFQEHLKEFDFWGWGDVDLIFGLLQDFSFQSLLDGYDVISFRKKWLSGSLCFLRNTRETTELFLSNPDYKKVFSTPEYQGFDEISRCWNQVLTTAFENINWPVHNFTLTVFKNANLIRCHFEDMAKESISKNSFLRWNSGRLTSPEGKAFTHYHFISEKRKPYFQYPAWTNVPELFYITEYGFFTEPEFKRRRAITFGRWITSMPKAFLNYLSRAKTILNRNRPIPKS
jgi:hypothetical protein